MTALSPLLDNLRMLAVGSVALAMGLWVVVSGRIIRLCVTNHVLRAERDAARDETEALASFANRRDAALQRELDEAVAKIETLRAARRPC